MDVSTTSFEILMVIGLHLCRSSACDFKPGSSTNQPHGVELHMERQPSSQTMQKAPHLTNFHKQARLEFARENMTTQWEKVIFTYKKKI
ncbi:unnamed protein product [Heligmosomoides polygyrus]|uniref:Secreted protein n=1 Tax=Heligmosomoides polygyrus TaxID=6339 RepID=A0A183GKL3_HELPZ|nr:unnamed protein product [Heligmosomoides polygyrus]